IAFCTMGALVAVGIGLIVASPRRGVGAPAPALALASGELGAHDTRIDGSKEAAKEANLTAVDARSPIVRPPRAWRVASLKDDANVEVSEGTFGKRGFVATLSQAGLPRGEIRRVALAFEGVHRVDRPKESDAFVLAKDKSKGTLIAFEYAASPF